MRWYHVFVLTALSAGIILLGWKLAFIQDDAFIVMRYAANLLAGNGLVFNPGQWVEGYTCPLWVMTLAAAGAVGLDMAAAARFLGILCAVATLWVTFAIGNRLRHQDDPSWLPLIAPILIASNPAFVSFATCGLDTALFAFLLIATTGALLKPRQTAVFPVWLALGYVLLTLTRPEGFLVFITAVLYVVFRIRKASASLESLLPPVAAYVILMAVITTWRWVTYGYPFPNPAYAKVFLDQQSLRFGVQYAWKFLASYGWFGGLIIIVALPTFIRHTRQAAWRYLAILFGIFTLYIIAVGGDVLKGLRFFVPLFPLWALLIQGGIGIIRCKFPAKPALAASISIVIAIAAVAAQLGNIPEEADRADLESGLTEKMTILAKWLHTHQPPETTIAANSIGALGYYTGYHIIDMVGLIDETIAHHPNLIEGIESPTKERTYNADHVLGQHPDFIAFDTHDKPNHAGDFALYMHPDFRHRYYRYPVWTPEREWEMTIFKAKSIPDDVNWANDSPIPLEAIVALRQGMATVSKAPETALEPFKRALALSPPDFAQPLEWLGMMELYYRDRPKARKLFLQALAVDSFSVNALRYLAKMSHNDGDNEQALRWGRQLIRMAPHAPEGWLTVAWILSNQDKKEEAVALLLKARETMGDHPGIIELIGSLKSGNHNGG